MSGVPYKLTATGFAFSSPCVLESILITATVDALDVTIYDANALVGATPGVPSGTRELGRFLVGAGSSDSFYLCATVKKGVYVKVNTGSSPLIYCYIP